MEKRRENQNDVSWLDGLWQEQYDWKKFSKNNVIKGWLRYIPNITWFSSTNMERKVTKFWKKKMERK